MFLSTGNKTCKDQITADDKFGYSRVFPLAMGIELPLNTHRFGYFHGFLKEKKADVRGIAQWHFSGTGFWVLYGLNGTGIDVI